MSWREFGCSVPDGIRLRWFDALRVAGAEFLGKASINGG